MALTPAGYRLIQSWEGCRLQAYPDPASGGAPWTIGYGHTGPEVKPGLVISQEQADAWFKSDVARFESAVDRCLLPNCQLRPPATGRPGEFLLQRGGRGLQRQHPGAPP